MNDFDAHVEISDYGLRTNIWMRLWPERAEFPIVPVITWEPATDAETREPAFSLKNDDARRLMDAMWRAGIRPSNGEGAEGRLNAVDSHLQDMRAIAFNKLGMSAPTRR